MSNRPRTYPQEISAEAVRLYRTGLMPRKIAAQLCVPVNTVKYWIRAETTAAIPLTAKPRKKSGSGVIAPRPYYTGARWWSD